MPTLLKNGFLGLLLLTIVNSLSAQRVAKIIYYQASKKAPKEIYVSQELQRSKNGEEAKGQLVTLKSNRFSRSFELANGDLKLSFLPSKHDVESETPAGCPSVLIPKEWSKVILLVSLNTKNKVLPIKVIAINASESIFPPGSIMFVNYTDIIVGGIVSEEELVVKAKSHKVITLPHKERLEFSLILDSYNAETKERRNLLRKRWLHIPKFRNVIFVTKLPPPRMAKCFVAEIRKF